MRYEVRLINGNQPIFVEATDFHNVNDGVVFFAERMRNNGTTDQWGNPVRRTQRVQIAFFNNVESVLEAPEEELGLPVVGAVPFQGDPIWFDDGRVNAVEPQVLAGRAALGFPAGSFGTLNPLPVDADGINWDVAQRDE